MACREADAGRQDVAGVLLIHFLRIFEENLSELIFEGEKSIKLILNIFRVSLFEVNHSAIILASLFPALFLCLSQGLPTLL